MDSESAQDMSTASPMEDKQAGEQQPQPTSVLMEEDDSTPPVPARDDASQTKLLSPMLDISDGQSARSEVEAEEEEEEATPLEPAASMEVVVSSTPPKTQGAAFVPQSDPADGSCSNGGIGGDDEVVMVMEDEAAQASANHGPPSQTISLSSTDPDTASLPVAPDAATAPSSTNDAAGPPDAMDVSGGAEAPPLTVADKEEGGTATSSTDEMERDDEEEKEKEDGMEVAAEPEPEPAPQLTQRELDERIRAVHAEVARGQADMMRHLVNKCKPLMTPAVLAKDLPCTGLLWRRRPKAMDMKVPVVDAAEVQLMVLLNADHKVRLADRIMENNREMIGGPYGGWMSLPSHAESLVVLCTKIQRDETKVLFLHVVDQVMDEGCRVEFVQRGGLLVLKHWLIQWDDDSRLPLLCFLLRVLKGLPITHHARDALTAAGIGKVLRKLKKKRNPKDKAEGSTASTSSSSNKESRLAGVIAGEVMSTWLKNIQDTAPPEPVGGGQEEEREGGQQQQQEGASRKRPLERGDSDATLEEGQEARRARKDSDDRGPPGLSSRESSLGGPEGPRRVMWADKHGKDLEAVKVFEKHDEGGGGEGGEGAEEGGAGDGRSGRLKELASAERASEKQAADMRAKDRMNGAAAPGGRPAPPPASSSVVPRLQPPKIPTRVAWKTPRKLREPPPPSNDHQQHTPPPPVPNLTPEYIRFNSDYRGRAEVKCIHESHIWETPNVDPNVDKEQDDTIAVDEEPLPLHDEREVAWLEGRGPDPLAPALPPPPPPSLPQPMPGLSAAGVAPGLVKLEAGGSAPPNLGGSSSSVPLLPPQMQQMMMGHTALFDFILLKPEHGGAALAPGATPQVDPGKLAVLMALLNGVSHLDQATQARLLAQPYRLQALVGPDGTLDRQRLPQLIRELDQQPPPPPSAPQPFPFPPSQPPAYGAPPPMVGGFPLPILPPAFPPLAYGGAALPPNATQPNATAPMTAAALLSAFNSALQTQAPLPPPPGSQPPPPSQYRDGGGGGNKGDFEPHVVSNSRERDDRGRGRDDYRGGGGGGPYYKDQDDRRGAELMERDGRDHMGGGRRDKERNGEYGITVELDGRDHSSRSRERDQGRARDYYGRGGQRDYDNHDRRDPRRGSNNKICLFWQSGKCERGNKCEFRHEGPGKCIPPGTGRLVAEAKDRAERDRDAGGRPRDTGGYSRGGGGGRW